MDVRLHSPCSIVESWSMEWKASYRGVHKVCSHFDQESDVFFNWCLHVIIGQNKAALPSHNFNQFPKPLKAREHVLGFHKHIDDPYKAGVSRTSAGSWIACINPVLYNVQHFVLNNVAPNCSPYVSSCFTKALKLLRKDESLRPISAQVLAALLRSIASAWRVVAPSWHIMWYKNGLQSRETYNFLLKICSTFWRWRPNRRPHHKTWFHFLTTIFLNQGLHEWCHWI